MRLNMALIIFVSLTIAGGCQAAGNWEQLHQQALESSARHEYVPALELARKELEAAEQPTEKTISMVNVGLLLERTGRAREARIWLERARDSWKSDETPAEVQMWTFSLLGDVDDDTGDYLSAVRNQRAALALARSDVDRGRMRTKLGEALRNSGDFQAARSAYAETAGMKGVRWQLPLNALAGMADVDRQMGECQTSITEWNQVLASAREHDDRMLEAIAERGLGSAWLESGSTQRAEPILRRALASFQSVGAPDLQIANTLAAMGELALRDHKPATAEELLERARKVQERELGEMHPTTAVTLELLGAAEARLGRWDVANLYYERAHSAAVAHFGADSAAAGVVTANWAIEQQRGNHLAEASVTFASALTTLPLDRPELSRLRQKVVLAYASTLKSMRRRNEAKELLRNSFAAGPAQEPK
jgi:tetratricopeptide (TPR) repeat protein